MIVLTPLVALSLALIVAAQASVLDAGERESFALISDAPSQVIRHVSELFRRHTDLAPLEIPAESIEGCGGSPVCIALRARPQLGKRNASYLAVISNAAGRISAVLIDLDEALRCADVDCAADRAVLATSLPQVVPDEAAARKYLDELVQASFRPVLEKSGHWEPYGSIEVTADREDAVISLDGKPLGSIRGTSRVEGVRPGARKLAFEHPEALPQEVRVEVKRGETTSIAVELASNAGAHPVRTVTLWTGAGIAAVGLGIAIWAAAASSSVDVYCQAEGDCSGTDFRTFAQLTGDEGDHPGPPKSGVLALPLGYSLFGAGAGFSLGALFIGEEQELPWIAWIVGTAVGGLAYGLSALID
jgi:hypothetical protein